MKPLIGWRNISWHAIISCQLMLFVSVKWLRSQASYVYFPWSQLSASLSVIETWHLRSKVVLLFRIELDLEECLIWLHKHLSNFVLILIWFYFYFLSFCGWLGQSLMDLGMTAKWLHSLTINNIMEGMRDWQKLSLMFRWSFNCIILFKIRTSRCTLYLQHYVKKHFTDCH